MTGTLITGPRLALRALDPADATAFARATADEQTVQSKSGRLPLSELAYAANFDRGVQPGEMPEIVPFAVVRLADGRLIGSVALVAVDWLNRTAETASYLLGEDVRGQGYGTEAKMLLLEVAFDRLHLHALHAWVRSTNTRSAAALAKQGYRPAGRRRLTSFSDGAWIDHLIFDLLREEWLVARDAWRVDQGARAARASGER